MSRASITRTSLLTVVSLALFACGAKQGQAEEPEVVLFGRDPGVPSKAPDSCKKVGKIEVSVIGQEASPDKALRAEALDLGGNAVAHVKKDGMEEVLLGRKVYYRAVALLCPSLPKLDPNASAAPVASSEPVPDGGWE
ncbi:MAG TPA: hypothetical protein VL400_04575 [Polyangiaceae bacterium]|jgi:hypothetical protein|nr:hypothetical protein [Polyangiaceae bacterium]